MSHSSLIEQNGSVLFYPDVFDQSEADRLYAELLSQIEWRQDHLKIYGKTVPLPRLTAWYGEKQYTYSGIEMQPRSWTEPLLLIKSRIEPLSNTQFNSVLLNLYRDGNDSVSWHSDDEPELGQNPIIGSISFGATRRFSLKRRYNNSSKRIDVELTHGSFLSMSGGTQHHWLHQVPKTKRITTPRINLTFRTIH